MIKKRFKILLVDDEPKFLDLIADRVRLKGLDPITARSGREAIEVVRSTPVDIAIVDYKMPEMDGIVTITKLKELLPGLETVLLTGYGNEKVKEAAERINSLYFEKDRMSEFWRHIHRYTPGSGVYFLRPDAPSHYPHGYPEESPGGQSPEAGPFAESAGYAVPPFRRPAAQDDDLRLAPDAAENPLIGTSPAFADLKRDIRSVAALDCSVLIQGEPGTETRSAAKTLHSLSPRKDALFVSVNCDAFGDELLTAEIFGHEKEVAFGTRLQKPGLLETAFGGTVLLNEIGDTPLPVQQRLLNVLQTRRTTRAGGTDDIPVNVRIVAATHRDLEPEVGEKAFLPALLEGINAFTLRVPPLRDRRGDIPLLAHYFFDKYRKAFDKPVRHMADAVVSALESYAFPGNVRELERMIEEAIILCEGDELGPSLLPRHVFEDDAPVADETEGFITLDELERRYILKVLKAMKGRRNETAKALGITRGSLWRKLKRFEKD